MSSYSAFAFSIEMLNQILFDFLNYDSRGGEVSSEFKISPVYYKTVSVLRSAIHRRLLVKTRGLMT